MINMNVSMHLRYMGGPHMKLPPRRLSVRNAFRTTQGNVNLAFASVQSIATCAPTRVALVLAVEFLKLLQAASTGDFDSEI